MTFLVLVTLYTLHYLPINGDRYFTLSLRWYGDLGLLDEVVEQLLQERINIRSRSVTRQPKTGKCSALLGLSTRYKGHDNPIINHLQVDERFDEVSCS